MFSIHIDLFVCARVYVYVCTCACVCKKQYAEELMVLSIFSYSTLVLPLDMKDFYGFPFSD